MAQLPEWFGRNICEIALAVFRTVAAAGIIAILAGGFTVYSDFQSFAATVKSIDQQVKKGILPEADKMIARLAVIVAANRRDIDRHEKELNQLQSYP